MDITRQAAKKHVDKLVEKGLLNPVNLSPTRAGHKAVSKISQGDAA